MTQEDFSSADSATPRLGFGTAGLMSRLDKESSVRLLDTAYEHGIRWFDTARSYGYGACEEVVGEWASRRPGVFVVTKAGVLPPRRTAGALRRIVMPVVKLAPAVRPLLRRGAARQVQVNLDPDTVIDSVETSLRSLASEHISLLLLHECTASDMARPAMIEALIRLQEQGKVGAFGTATSTAHTREILATIRRGSTDRLVLWSVAQVPDDALQNASAEFMTGDQRLIRHSTLAPLRSVVKHLEDATTSAEWGRKLDMRISADDVAVLLLRAALRLEPQGRVLYASQSVERVVSGASAIRPDAAEDARADVLVQLISAARQAGRLN